MLTWYARRPRRSGDRVDALPAGAGPPAMAISGTGRFGSVSSFSREIGRAATATTSIVAMGTVRRCPRGRDLPASVVSSSGKL